MVHDGLLFKNLPKDNMVAAVNALEAYDFLGFNDRMSHQNKEKVFFPIQKMYKTILDGDPDLHTNLVKKYVVI